MTKKLKPSTAIFPSSEADWVECSRTKSGRIFSKHILNMGQLLHPVTGKPLTIDDQFVNKLKANFENGICDIVQVPLAGPRNEHTEDPNRNIGEVVGIESRDGKVYAMIDARDEAAADKLGKTLLGASAMMHLNYKDTKTGKDVGPTLLHVCVTNRPYVTGLEDYQEIVAATADSSSDAAVIYVAQPEDEPEEAVVEASAPIAEEVIMTREEHIAALKELGVDVQALLDSQAATEQTALSNDKLAEALQEDRDERRRELANTNKELGGRLVTLEKVQAGNVVDGLVAQGRILPAQRDVFVELRLSNEAMFDALVPEKPIVALSVVTPEAGVTPVETDQREQDLNKDLEHYTELYAKSFQNTGKGRK